ncbi:MAG: carboxypeptidase regulatory-like domain-containing protein [Ferruginibacter sp.]
MKKITTLLTAMLLTMLLYAQNKPGKISGSVTGPDKKPVEAATVQLLKATGNALIKTAITDQDGNYAFEKIAEGNYIISISAAGFAKKQTVPVTVSAANATVNLAATALSIQSKNMEAVTVTAAKPFIEQKTDRTVVNVEASPSNAGATALEVLEKSPGISVDNDGNISLKGKQGVIIMMDGKPTYLSAADLANVLKNMPASALEQI